MAESRGFSIGHQKVVLSCDLRGRLKGYAELVIVPLNSELRTVFLNCSQCRISNVSTAGHPDLFYLHADPLAAQPSNPTFKPTDVNDFRAAFPELKRKLYSAVNQADEGELGISLPDGVVKQTDMPDSLPDQPAAYDPIALTIEYEVVHPQHGVRFVGGDDDSVIPHVYTTLSSTDGPRCWMPCIDTLWDRSSWELQLVVPRQLKFSAQDDAAPIASTSSPEDDRADPATEQSLPILAIASGELIEQIVHPRDSNLVIFRYSQSSPTSAQHIGWAVGPFQIHDLAPPPVDDAIISEDGNAKLHAFCLPNFEVELEHTVSFVRQALDFLVAEYGSYPFGSYKLVFIDDSDASVGKSIVHNSATMTTFPSELLHPPSVIEQGFESRHTLSYALASQWVGINIIQKTWADTWLINGLGFHLAGQFLRRLLGTNEYRFRLKKDVQKCCALDVDMPPLCEPRIDHPPEGDVLPFVNLKSPLVLHILDQRLLKSGTMHGLSRVLPKIFLTAISGELKEGLLSTHQFLRYCRKISSTDLRVFSDQWIYGSGCPTFNITAQFSRKKMAVEMQFNQTCPSWDFSVAAPWQDVAQSNPVSVFEGQMTIRVHEADGTPYEHVLDLRESSKRHDVPFNTKYKRIRRQTKRYQARAEAMKAAAAGDVEAQEELALIDMSFGTQIWEEEDERISWRVADWTEADDEKMAHATYEWIRIDADFEWICTINFEQPDFMWVSQLQRDRDVVAQLEAVQALTRLQTPVVASSLAKAVLVSNYFFRIRVEAIYALASMATAPLDFLGLFYLFKLYETRFCYEPARPTKSAFGFNLQPKPNDFTDFTEYFIRLAIVGALAIVRNQDAKAPSQVVRFLVNLLTYNDNSSNPYSDANYLCAVFKGLAHVFVDVPAPEASELFGPSESEEGKNPLLLAAVDEVSRYMSMDRLVPSYRNSITIAGLEWKFKMMLAGLIPADLRLFFAYSREGNYAPVRMTAFDGIVLLKGLKDPSLANYLFTVLRDDKSPAVQARLSETLIASLPVLAALDQLGVTGAGANEALFIEEENAPKPVIESEFNTEMAVLALRKEYGKGESMRQCLLSTLLNYRTDLIIRFAILKLCETLYRPKDEPVPKLKFRMPASATPTAAPAAQGDTPRIKLVASGAKSTPTEPAGVPYDEFESSAVVQPSAMAGVAQPQSFKLSLSRPSEKKKKEAKKAADAKKGKQPKAHKAQNAGMTAQDVQACRSCHSKMLKDKVTTYFRMPVDPARDGAPGYFDKVSKPMDLMTMGAKLENGQYSTRDQFRQDFEQIVENAHIYNGAEHVITKMADSMHAKFMKQWTRIDATLARKRGQDEASGAKLTVRPSGQGDASLSIDQLTSQSAAVPIPQAPPQPFKIKLSGANKPRPSPPLPPPQPSSGAEPEAGPSAAVPIPEPAMPPPKPKIKLSLGGKPKAPSGSPAPAINGGANGSPQPQPGPKPPKKVKIAAPSEASQANGNHPVGEQSAQVSLPSTSLDTLGGEELPSAAPAPAPSAPEPVVSAPAPTAAAPELPPAAEHRPIEPVPAPAPPVPAPAPALGQMQASQPAQPPPVKLSIKQPSMKIKAPKPKPEPMSEAGSFSNGARQASNSPAPAPAPAARPKSKQPTDEDDTPTPSRDPLDDAKRTKDVLTKAYNLPMAAWFRLPVDPIASGCPTYFDEIKHPMDLTTLWNNYESGQYGSWSELNSDFELIVSNCHQFNPPHSAPCYDADKLKAAWQQLWREAETPAAGRSGTPQLTGYDKEKKVMQAAMKTLSTSDTAKGGIFAVPVDPIALNIPDYFDVIPREEARDLRTIKTKVERDAYRDAPDTLQALEDDLNLMLSNARKFNPPATFVHEYARGFQNDVNRAMKSMKDKMRGGGGSGGGNKRSGSALASTTIKKAKH